MDTQVQVSEYVAGRYHRPGDWVVDTPEGVRAAVDALFERHGDKVTTRAIVERLGEDALLGVLVDPVTGYVALHWCFGEHSLNPEPFADAPLVPEDGDNDPLNFWMRDTYVAEADARRAIEEFVATGNRPTAVRWQPWGWEAYELPDWYDDEGRDETGGRYHLITD
ncbi:Imm1 family immunity protein [Saccharothrix violaceirubra]|uniref:Uncharacterized protein n=1 Tax=Saccharothrix violaceirubra TaxID=413306 RepID=A0A7W7T8X9_9PSEU|nr:Imm1 family immunity protein [Saccharothrix violaceirubra]MBB4968766.1 hypothetical protein [Saccharothrix violaceirubra]